ncbi:6-bladed beta-propeller [Fulvivirga maritima]|uniref:6-bladed beta-propeller n=1 Tax=Fulvivirga maritima TaxID=2904247 RepID=UPI001F4647B0|nr:6-bladed beta-propeller [Fulvivirga maritima]UII28633.1 6-bladed beta-propeller [Fulvivirga maritima]
MKLKTTFLLVVTTILCTSCSNRTEDVVSNLKEIHLSPSTNTVKYIDDMIDSIQVTPIQSTDSITPIFSSITKGVNYDSLYFFLDGQYTGNIIVTNKYGSLIKLINNKGNAPYQYKEVTDFTITDKNQIEIYDSQAERFYYYDFEGNFISRKDIGYKFMNYKFRDSLYYLFTAKFTNVHNNINYTNDILIVQPEGEIINNYLPFKPENFEEARVHNTHALIRHGEELLFSDHLIDTIFNISPDTIRAKYVFVYENNPLPASLLQNGHQDFINLLNKDINRLSDYDFSAALIDSDNENLMFSYVHKLNKHIGVYNEQTSSIREFSFEGYSFTASQVLTPLFNNHKRFISVAPWHTLNEIKASFRSNPFNDLIPPEDPETPYIISFIIKR